MNDSNSRRLLKEKKSDRAAPSRPTRGSWVLVAIAWLAVGLPLAWGIVKTLEKAAILFRG